MIKEEEEYIHVILTVIELSRVSSGKEWKNPTKSVYDSTRGVAAGELRVIIGHDSLARAICIVLILVSCVTKTSLWTKERLKLFIKYNYGDSRTDHNWKILEYHEFCT